MQNEQLRRRMAPVLQTLQGLCLRDRTPVTGLRWRPCPYHGWRLVHTDPAGPEWQPFAPGTAFGGLEAHYAFRAEVAVPAAALGAHAVCLVSTGATDIWNYDNPQFLAYLDGRLLCGLDTNHTEFDLPASGPVQLGLYAYCNTPAQDIFLRIETAVRDDEVTGLYYDLKAPYEVLCQLDPAGIEAITIGRHLARALDLLDLRDPGSAAFASGVAAARRYLKEEFYGRCCHEAPVREGCVGHTHIDVAWLWTLAQTHEKALRSFATVDYLMDRYPEYKFMASQPQLYDFVRQDSPTLYARIRARVAEDRWEPEGGMWLESDCNMPSGESLIRQFLHGQGFLAREFGKTDSHILWLPDAFGFSGALPQIMKQCGMRWFMTTKLGWNDTDCMPHDLMRWRGIDGTEVLAYFISTKDYVPRPDRDPHPNFNTTYNGLLNARQVMGCWQRFQDKDLTQDVLQCYGTGDGGGGPTAEMLELQRRLAQGIPGAPQTYQTHVAPFFDKLEQDLATGGSPLPCWSGELYFEYHRGVFTTQARNKYANRRAEFANLTAETLAALALPCPGYAYPAEALHRAWELTLLNQFHDTLPGSAIGEVYRVSQQQYAEVLDTGRRVTERAMQAIAAHLRTERDGVLVFNPLGFCRDTVVSVPCAQEAAVCDGSAALPCTWQNGTLRFLALGVPAKGWRFFPFAPAAPAAPFADVQQTEDGYRITTPRRRLALNARGELTSLYDLTLDRELLPAGQVANELQLFDDRPDAYDAWNLERWYADHRYATNEPVRLTLEENSAVLCRFRLRRALSHSTLEQTITLYPHTDRIDFETWVDWQEEHVLLKVAFPVDVYTDHAQYDIQFGSITRPTHANTPWDAARFEVCAHKWADLSEPGFGAALLNDGRYGYDVQDGVLRLSLLRAATYPDPQADRGPHHFTYALLPHAGDWRQGSVIPQAYDLNAPAPALPVAVAPDGVLPPVCSLFAVDSPNVILETVKQAEDGNGLILRLYESWGTRTRARLTLPARAVAAPCTPLEQPLPDAPVPQPGPVALTLHPYELCSLRVTR